MEIKLHEIEVQYIHMGYEDSQENGVVGFGGQLNIRPAFQREFVYDENIPSAIVSKMDGNVRGARDLRNVIRRNIEDKVSTLMIDNLGTVMNKILVTSTDNNIEVSFE